MNSDFIELTVWLHDTPNLIGGGLRKYPAEHSRSAGRAAGVPQN
jgi:hypothetical protein